MCCRECGSASTCSTPKSGAARSSPITCGLLLPWGALERNNQAAGPLPPRREGGDCCAGATLGGVSVHHVQLPSSMSPNSQCGPPLMPEPHQPGGTGRGNLAAPSSSAARGIKLRSLPDCYEYALEVMGGDFIVAIPQGACALLAQSAASSQSRVGLTLNLRVTEASAFSCERLLPSHPLRTEQHVPFISLQVQVARLLTDCWQTALAGR